MSVSEKRDFIYHKLLEFANSNNASLQLDTADLNPNDNHCFVDVSSIDKYIKNLKITLTEIKEYIEGNKDEPANHKSRSLKILNDLLKLTPNSYIAVSESFLTEVEKLSKKLKRIGRLNFFGSFGASLNR